MSAKKDDGRRIISENRKARHEYFITDSWEAGIELKGTEVKSLRLGECSLDESFARIEKGEAVVYAWHINPYRFGNQMNHDPMRTRKLLLHRRQIAKLAAQLQQEGLTLIPLRLYWLRGRAKIELGVCKGKNAADKRDSLKDRDQRRDIDRALRERG